jgi:mannose-6-phosphate isomerase-like protein (cupin superfamily)
MLTPGELFLLPERTLATIRNNDGPPATFLVIALRKPGGSSGLQPVVRPGADKPAVTATEVAGSLLTTWPSGPAVLGLGRATIAPGASFPVATPGAALFVVEAGTLSLARADGTVWSRRSADGAITTATDGILRPGDAVTLGPGASCDLRNAGTTPLVLLAVTITPVDPNGAGDQPKTSS